MAAAAAIFGEPDPAVPADPWQSDLGAFWAKVKANEPGAAGEKTGVCFGPENSASVNLLRSGEPPA